MRRLQLLSASHDRAPAEIRNQLNLSTNNWRSLKETILQLYSAYGVVVLVTCNRIEIIYEAERDIRFELLKAWTDRAGLAYGDTQPLCRSYIGTSIVLRYLLSLSLGLKSAIYGDDQILHQLKRAYESAREEKTLSTLLERSYQQIMQMHKHVYNNTQYRTQTVSLAYHALKSVVNHLGKEKATTANILIIGAGDMATQVKKYLPKFNFGSVIVSNRTIAKAEALASGSDIQVADYNNLQEGDYYDVVISCATQGMSHISYSLRPALAIDLSTDSLVEIKFKHSFPIIKLEELQSLITAQNVQRMSSLPVVKRIISTYAQAFEEWVYGWEERRRVRLAA